MVVVVVDVSGWWARLMEFGGRKRQQAARKVLFIILV